MTLAVLEQIAGDHKHVSIDFQATLPPGMAHKPGKSLLGQILGFALVAHAPEEIRDQRPAETTVQSRPPIPASICTLLRHRLILG